MLIDEPAVVVPRRSAQRLLELLEPEVARRDWLPEDVRRIIGDLARAAQAEDMSLVPSGSGVGSGRFRGLILNGVDTETAGNALGISPRAVRKRLLNGTLRGEKRHGAWVVDLEEGT